MNIISPNRIVVMSMDSSKYGYFSSSGLVECDSPEISTFLDPIWSTERLVKKITLAKIRRISILEGFVEKARKYDLKVMTNYSARDYKSAMDELAQEQARVWVIAELIANVLATV